MLCGAICSYLSGRGSGVRLSVWQQVGLNKLCSCSHLTCFRCNSAARLLPACNRCIYIYNGLAAV